MKINFEAKINGYVHLEFEANNIDDAKEIGEQVLVNWLNNNPDLDDVETEYLCVSDEQENDYYY